MAWEEGLLCKNCFRHSQREKRSLQVTSRFETIGLTSCSLEVLLILAAAGRKLQLTFREQCTIGSRTNITD